MSDERIIADALGKILTRRFRGGLYADLTRAVAEGLDGSTYPVFSAIARASEPPSAREVALDVGSDRSIVSRRASALTAAGLVKVVGGADARASYYELTSAGVEAAAVMRDRLDAAIAEHVSDWSRSDIAQFARLLAAFGERPL